MVPPLLPLALFLCLTAVLPSHADGLAMHAHPNWRPNFRHSPMPTNVRFRVAKWCRHNMAISTVSIRFPYAAMSRAICANGFSKVFSSVIMTKPSRLSLACRKSVTPADRSFVTFTLNPAAKFSDGTQVTTDDVAFSWETLREKGRPNHRYYYGRVTHISRPTDNSISFHFDLKPPTAKWH